ncbi:HEPN domain-containing protein [Granulicella arctica]|uniref:HEPN domain-containing protein n=1 Tax=Granulicella arctica TaxID=940613 RepID=UPI0021E05875|nr:HEPN domain-containing protein [Granulicella arctica]
MTAKEKRIIGADLKTLFSLKAFLVLNTIEEWKAVGLVHPTVRTDENSHPLSEAGISALRRITTIMENDPALRKACSQHEIALQVHTSYEGWIKRSLQPDADEFIQECAGSLMATVKERFHLVMLDGLELKDLDKVELGTISIYKPDMKLMSVVQFGGAITEDWIERDFSKGLWLIGKTEGSPEVSLERFDHQTLLVIGILAVCGAILYEGSIWRSHLRAGLSPHRQTMPTSIFRWDADGGDPTVSRLWGEDQKLPLDAKLIDYLREHCFLNQLSALSSEEEKTRLQQSIERALYWFADAHGDRNTTMRFVKLWSCVECFFAFQEENITEANARGMATILTFSGYQVWTVEDYSKMKSRLRDLYGLRSRAVHRAEFDEVQLVDLRDLSRWVAWLIISMTALAERGYRTLSQVKEQTDRLDAQMRGA